LASRSLIDLRNTSTSIPSPDDSIVTACNNIAIIDTNGNTWVITAAGLMAVNLLERDGTLRQW
jgi:hypothetical protein